MRDVQTPEEVIHATLVKQYDKYYRLAFCYASNQEDAMDIVQEGACRAIAAAEQLKYPQFADTWVYRIMINTAREYLRRNRREVAAGEELPEEGREDTYEETDLYRALQQLDEKERTVVICKYFEDMTLDEIADTEKENVNTVKSRLYRALKKLRGFPGVRVSGECCGALRFLPSRGPWTASSRRQQVSWTRLCLSVPAVH